MNILQTLLSISTCATTPRPGAVQAQVGPHGPGHYPGGKRARGRTAGGARRGAQGGGGGAGAAPAAAQDIQLRVQGGAVHLDAMKPELKAP
jgi:hypothetical protein